MSDAATLALAREARAVAQRREAQLDAIERALVEGDDPRALRLLRAFLGLEEDPDAEGDRAPARQLGLASGGR